MDSVSRAGHLFAERKGTRGKRILLIGHLDTVFEKENPFQRFERISPTAARGPGALDMKGGDIAILHALKALQSAGALEGAHITVAFTGDEENPGEPVSVARRDLIEAAKQSDAAPFVPALAGLGASGTGSHAPDETVDLASLPLVTKRAAFLIYRLTRP